MSCNELPMTVYEENNCKMIVEIANNRPPIERDYYQFQLIIYSRVFHSIDHLTDAILTNRGKRNEEKLTKSSSE